MLFLYDFFFVHISRKMLKPISWKACFYFFYPTLHILLKTIQMIIFSFYLFQAKLYVRHARRSVLVRCSVYRINISIHSVSNVKCANVLWHKVVSFRKMMPTFVPAITRGISGPSVRPVRLTLKER